MASDEIQCVDEKSGQELGERHWKQAVFTRLLDATKKCQQEYKLRGAVITDQDACVLSLLSQIEAVLCHGLINNQSLTKHVTSLLSASWTTSPLNMAAESECAWAVDAHACADLWPVLRDCCSEVDIVRILQMSHIVADASRARALIRQVLNDGSLERLLTNVVDKSNRHHYHAWAFVRDVEWSSTLSQVARGISKVRFSLSLQSSEYRNYDVARPEQYAPPPVHAVSQRSTSKGRAPKSGIVKPLVNHVSFDGPTSAASQPMAKRLVTQHKSAGLAGSDGHMKHIRQRSQRTASSSGSVLSNPDVINTETSVEHQNVSTIDGDEDIVSNASGSDVVDDHRFNQLFLGDDRTNFYFPQLTLASNFDVDKNHVRGVSSPIEFTSNSSAVEESEPHSTSFDSHDVNYEIQNLKMRLEESERQNRALLQELESTNSIIQPLREQVQTYVQCMVDIKSTKEDISKLVSEGQSNAEFDGDSISPAKYEEKLVQMAIMHAELLELNDRLIHNLNEKSVQLRRVVGLCKTYVPQLSLDEFIPSASKNVDSASSLTPVQHSTRVRICVPSAFLTSKQVLTQKVDVHHVFMINVRLEGEEWNAYRRFAQFVTWHKQMCKQDKYFGERFQLPPKKVVGKMEKSFVDMRRRGVETYLQDCINYVVSTYPEFTSVPLDKRSLTHACSILNDAQ